MEPEHFVTNGRRGALLLLLLLHQQQRLLSMRMVLLGGYGPGAPIAARVVVAHPGAGHSVGRRCSSSSSSNSGCKLVTGRWKNGKVYAAGGSA